MPTYDYECDRCGAMEIFQSIKDDTLRVCPQCQSKKFRKLISSGAGVIFKGAGFWETDYNRSDSYRQSADKETAAPKEGKQDGAEKAPAAKTTTSDQGTSKPASGKKTADSQ